MLRSLSIRNIVLIERLDLAFERGLCVLTGETGSGKSILLDALGLAIGVRADADLVATGAGQSAVAAEFEIAADHPAHAILSEQGLDDLPSPERSRSGFAQAGDATLVLRRVVTERGRSRAFINDQPVSVALLRRVGETLVEVHGQFEAHGLLDPATHIRFVDAHGGHHALVAEVAGAWRAWKDARAALAEAEEAQSRARRDEDYLRHASDELARLDPKPGEESALAESRAILMHGEHILAALNEAAADLARGGIEAALRSALQKLERAAPKAPGRLDASISALERALIEVNEGSAELERASAGLDLDPAALERAEERLFELRRLARKHGARVDDLARLRDEIDGRLAQIDDGGAAVERLGQAVAAARAAYVAAAERLSAAREVAAARLTMTVEREFPALMLGAAKFRVRRERLAESDWGEQGTERIGFEVQTNPNTAAGPLNRVASGGELARIMLALKVALAEADPVPTLVFDEVDAGVGGAAAAAVGERLAQLGVRVQVLVVTHSPQVAARGSQHWRILKTGDARASRTEVELLADDARTLEIARMLAGVKVTEEARAAAASLLAGEAAPTSKSGRPRAKAAHP